MPYYLTNKDKIWIVPKGTTVKTTEGIITTDDDFVMGYKGHLFQDHLDVDNATVKK